MNALIRTYCYSVVGLITILQTCTAADDVMSIDRLATQLERNREYRHPDGSYSILVKKSKGTKLEEVEIRVIKNTNKATYTGKSAVLRLSNDKKKMVIFFENVKVEYDKTVIEFSGHEFMFPLPEFPSGKPK